MEKVLKTMFSTPSPGIERHNAGSTRAGQKSLRRQADAQSTDRFPKIVVIPHIAEVELIDRRRPQRLRVAQAEQLGPAQIERVETWHARPTLRHRIGIVKGVAVREVVRRQQAPMAVVIEPVRSLVIPQMLVLGRGRERVGAHARWGMYCSRFFAGADHAEAGIRPFGKSTLGGTRASGRVVGLAGRNGISEFLR